MSTAAGQECPLCCEPLDATERQIQFCSCGFSMCRFCWKKLMESDARRCPHCRKDYEEGRMVTLPLVKMDEVADDLATKKKKKKNDRKKGIKLTGQERKNLQELRILQKNLVYAVGLSLDICIESVLAQNEFFGQFGPLKKISVNRSSPYSSGQSRNGPTGAAYVTFVNDDDAANCVAAIDGAVWDGHYIRACFGTTKYCQAFLKGAQCNNPDCLYMHYLVNEGTFTKEEMNSGFAKGKPEFYSLINFDRSKGPVPGSLAKPPKGPGSMGSRKDSQPRPSPSLDLDMGKRRSIPEGDWPQLTQNQSVGTDKTDRLSLEMDRASLMSRRSAEASWTSTALKSTSSSSGTLIPPPLHSLPSSGQNQKKTVAVLSSPVKVKMVSGRPSRGSVPAPMDPPFGHPIAEEEGRGPSPEHSTSGLYVPPHSATAESLLRATKSASPLEEDPSRDYASMEDMIRKRISVPERMIDDAVSKLLPNAVGRRGPPPGFNKLQTCASAQEISERSAASDRLLQQRLSYEAAADAIKRQHLQGSFLDQIAQNMISAQSNVDLSANLLANQPPSGDVGIQTQHFVGEMESPFGGGGTGQPNIGQSNMGYPIGYNAEMRNDLLQSFITASSGVSLYPLQGKGSTQLSARGSLPTMQTRLSADAVERRGLYDLETLQKSQMTAEGPIPMNAYLAPNNLAGERATQQQNMAFASNNAPGMAASPFNDPAILAFKKPGQQEVYHMGSSGNAPPDRLMPLGEQNTIPATPFDDPNGRGLWTGGLNVPVTPFLGPPAEMHPSPWMTASHSSGPNLGVFPHSVSDQVIDAAGYFCPDEVSSTQT